MKKINFFSCLLVILSICMFPVSSQAQTCEALDARKLKEMLIGMGLTVKDLNTEAGKEKYEVSLSAGGFNIPVGYEISPSGNFVWLTANLGKPKDATSTMNAELLKQNANIQPCQFYISGKGNLMMGLAIENRGLTPAIMRRHTDKFSGDVSKTSSYWQ
ncbi:MAG TPA: hypothetical protein PLZ45_10175 [Ferruginibacter sp.]|nr:hypothetical protein [Ferruginibacter sp.]